MLVARLYKFDPKRKQLEGVYEGAITLPANCPLMLKKITDVEYHVIAVLPLRRATKAVQKGFVDTFVLPEQTST